LYISYHSLSSFSHPKVPDCNKIYYLMHGC
jgi:hypothetical protein